MRNFMKLLAIVLVLVMIVAFAGCNNSKGNSEGTSQSSKKMSGTLKIAFFKGGYGDEWINAIAAEYKRNNPDVQLSLQGDPGITAKMGPRLESGANIPDIAFILSTNWQQWAAKGYLEDLSDLYDTTVENNKKFKDLLQPDVVDYGKYMDKYWSIPWNDGCVGIAYNAGMFEENGWEVPKTMKEMQEVLLPAIKQKGIAPFAWGGKVMGYWDFPVIAWWAQYEGMEGMRTFMKMEGSEVYAQEGRLKALEQYERLVLDPTNSIKGAMAMDHIQSQMAFVQGKAAMMPNGAWLENEMKNSLPEGFKMKMMQVPAIEGAKDPLVNNTMIGDFVIVPSKAQNKELAKDFLRFMTEEKMLRLYTEKTGTPRPFIYDIENIPGLTDFNRSVLDIWKNSKNLYLYSGNPMYSTKLFNWPQIGAPYVLIQIGDMTAKQAHSAMAGYVDSKWEELKKEFNLN